MRNIIDYAVEYIVKTTQYTPYQCYRVIELIMKHGDKTPFYVTKKQKAILDLLVSILEGKEPENAKK